VPIPDLNTFLVSLLIRLGIMAAIASVLARSNRFKFVLMQESRTLNQRLGLALWLSSVFAAGVATRLTNPNYQAADLGLEGSLLAGLLGGYVTGLLSGIRLEPRSGPPLRAGLSAPAGGPACPTASSSRPAFRALCKLADDPAQRPHRHAPAQWTPLLRRCRWRRSAVGWLRVTAASRPGGSVQEPTERREREHDEDCGQRAEPAKCRVVVIHGRKTTRSGGPRG